MKKIPTLFRREFENHKVVKVLPEYTNETCQQALYSGRPTVKWDGSCCAVIDGVFYKRYDAKKGKPIPENAIKCQHLPDPITGHLPCWVPVNKDDPSDKWFVAAMDEVCKFGAKLPDGTYEAIGKHFQGNPYHLEDDVLILHGAAVLDDFILPDGPNIDFQYEYIYKYLASNEIEGIVFWKDDEPVCKIKRTDFGLPWPIKEE